MSSATAFSFEELVKLHRGMVQRGQGKRIGRMIKIVLGEIPQGVTLKISPTEIAREGRTLDWFERGPLLALSPGDVDLLVASPVLPLPDKPDPAWTAPLVEQAEIEKAVAASGHWTPPRAPLVKQLPEDRGARKIKGANILLFEPVYQVLFRPEGINVFGCVQAMTDDASGTVMTFAWNFDEGAGYFYGGRFIVKI
jgi:hypothetical protein